MIKLLRKKRSFNILLVKDSVETLTTSYKNNLAEKI